MWSYSVALFSTNGWLMSDPPPPPLVAIRYTTRVKNDKYLINCGFAWSGGKTTTCTITTTRRYNAFRLGYMWKSYVEQQRRQVCLLEINWLMKRKEAAVVNQQQRSAGVRKILSRQLKWEWQGRIILLSWPMWEWHIHHSVAWKTHAWKILSARFVNSFVSEAWSCLDLLEKILVFQKPGIYLQTDHLITTICVPYTFGLVCSCESWSINVCYPLP